MVNILIVDDSFITRKIVRRTFSEMQIPFFCLEAGDGKKALDLMEPNYINIVFLDWNMPEMDGIEFLKVVRDIPKYEDIPIIMVTSEKGKFSVVEALQNGATDYIVKPIQDRIFKEKVTDVLTLAG